MHAKTIIALFLFFSYGKIKKVIKKAIKLVAIENNCGFAVKVRNKKEGIQRIDKLIRILLSIFKRTFLKFKFIIAKTIE
jgi:hypothetical protein